MEESSPRAQGGLPKEADHSRTPSPGWVRWRLVVSYDGTAYQGWQWQKTGVGVQQKLEEALARLFPSAPRVHASSRTDTGVHALGMVVHFDLPRGESRLPARKLPLALNAWLPEDIRVRTAVRCRSPFHARFDATGKQYRYFVWNHPAHNPLLRRHAWHVPRRLDLSRVRQAARLLVGSHDFAAFTTNPGYERGSTCRRVRRLDLRRSGPLLTFVIEGDGFLYRMCRGLVGTLVQVGLGRFTPEDVQQMLAARDRRLGGMSAPPHGLVLWKVSYRKAAEPGSGDLAPHTSPG